MDQIVGRGVIVVAGQEFAVQYAMAMRSQLHGRETDVTGRVRGSGLFQALPITGTISGALRMEGGLELAVSIKRGAESVAVFRTLKKPAAVNEA